MSLKLPEEIEFMRQAGHIAAQALQAMKKAVQEGERSLPELNIIAHSTILSLGGNPAFKGYRPQGMSSPYEWAICASVNEEIVHGLPTHRRKLIDGDIVSLDTGAEINGWLSDTAITIAVGEIDEQSQKLIDLTRQGLEAGIDAIKPGGRISEITSAIYRFANLHNLVTCESLSGHGIGKSLHEPPIIPNKPPWYASAGTLDVGTVICVEPMFSFKNANVKNGMIEQVDEWTIRSADRSRVAHFEHMIAITSTGVEVLT